MGSFGTIGIAFVATLVYSVAAIASPRERPGVCMAGLHCAPFQLLVTVLSVEEKQAPGDSVHLWYRVRVERVMAGDGIAPGDEVAVVSGRHILAPGVTGSTGDRGPFAGPNGLPVRGDRARIFASGSSKILNSVPPNGWQVVEQSISFVSADEVHGSDLTMPLLASIVQKACGTTTVVHLTPETLRTQIARCVWVYRMSLWLTQTPLRIKPTLEILPQHAANHKPTCGINMFWLNSFMLCKVGHRPRYFCQSIH